MATFGATQLLALSVQFFHFFVQGILQPSDLASSMFSNGKDSNIVVAKKEVGLSVLNSHVRTHPANNIQPLTICSNELKNIFAWISRLATSFRHKTSSQQFSYFLKHFTPCVRGLDSWGIASTIGAGPFVNRDGSLTIQEARKPSGLFFGTIHFPSRSTYLEHRDILGGLH